MKKPMKQATVYRLFDFILGLDKVRLLGYNRVSI